MADASDTSKVAEQPDLGPGYRLTARGRQEVEDHRLSLLERILDPLLAEGVTWSGRAGGALRLALVGVPWQFG